MVTISDSKRVVRAAGLAVATVVGLCLPAMVEQPVSAFAGDALVYTVTKTADTNNAPCTAGPDPDCSLREAIAAANGDASASEIVMGIGTYTLTIAPLTPFGIANGDLDITAAVTIDGNGSTVNAGALDRVFNIQNAGTVVIHDLTITNGNVTGALTHGGGILVQSSTLILTDSTVSNSDTEANGGGIAAIGSYEPATGVSTLATLTLNNSIVLNNTASNGGGISCVLCALTTSAGSVVSQNTVTVDGGGVEILGDDSTASMTSSTIDQNDANRGGGLSVPFGASVSTLTRNRIVSNDATSTGDAIFNSLGTVTATNNWWGCNYGPGDDGNGCAIATNGVSGSVSTAPYLVLKMNVTPLAIQVNSPASVTGDLTFNSADVDTSSGGTVPDGVLVAFTNSESLGTFATPSVNTVNGLATDVYTSGGSAGVEALQVEVDGQALFTNLAIIVSPTTDLNGDGIGDALTYDPATGEWVRLITQPDGSFVSTVGTWATGWTVVPASFNNDLLTDFFLFKPSGQWSKELNNGTGFTTQTSGNWGPGFQRYVMDLDADGISDVFIYNPETGNWFKAVAADTVAGFNYSVGAWNPGWEITTIRLNADELDDMFLFNRTDGRWFWVLGTAGPSFTYPATEVWYNGWQIYPGDFNGDGLGDLLLHDPPTGAYIVGTNNGFGTGFNYTGAYWSLGWKPYVGDLDGDGLQDLLLHSAVTGQYAQMISDGGGDFVFDGGETWSEGWNIYLTDLNADSRVDVLLYHPVSGVWYQARNTAPNTFVYTTGTWNPALIVVVRSPFF